MILIERHFTPRTPLKNTKEGKIKDLKDLSCMWCKSHDAHPCLSENMGHTMAGISRTMSHQLDGGFLSKDCPTTKSIDIW
jgi:hypothetical protein